MSAWQPLGPTSGQPSWQLPDYLADVLPLEAQHIEALRRRLLDTAQGYGYELVMPPLLEHLESLLTGTGEALGLQTFKLVDQLSGRMLGLRADTTPQVARIDAHLLNRNAVTRLCYCGPVLHTHPERPHATREPLQFGAEIYGHAGPEADLETMLLALDCLKAAGVGAVTVDLADVRIIDALLEGLALDAETLAQVHAALAAKDASTMKEIACFRASANGSVLSHLQQLTQLYGDASVLDKAQALLPGNAQLQQAVQVLRDLGAQLAQIAGVTVSFDLADLRGYAYYRGARFSMYAPGGSDALVRGGRYDGIGAAFAHGARLATRPAAGFSLDLKALVTVAKPAARAGAIRAPWGAPAEADGVALRAVIARLRQSGETVVCMPPETAVQQVDGMDGIHFDRELAAVAGLWVVQAL